MPYVYTGITVIVIIFFILYFFYRYNNKGETAEEKFYRLHPYFPRYQDKKENDKSDYYHPF